MKKILLSVIAIIFLCKFIGALGLRYKINSLENIWQNVVTLNNALQYLDDNKQDEDFEIYETTPTLANFGKGNVKLMKSGTVYRIYIRIDDDLIKFEGTKVN